MIPLKIFLRYFFFFFYFFFLQLSSNFPESHAATANMAPGKLTSEQHLAVEKMKKNWPKTKPDFPYNKGDNVAMYVFLFPCLSRAFLPQMFDFLAFFPAWKPL